MLDNYEMNEDGLIRQVKVDPIVYDRQYVAERYDTYGELNAYMGHLRLGYLIGAIGQTPTSLLDVGYGNGAFLNVAKKVVHQCFGYDVTGYPLPEKVEFAEDWLTRPVDVVTFFDVLEHFEDPYIISKLNTNYVVISLPWCLYNHMPEPDEWFANWKHRRPNEHLWFFDGWSMRKFADRTGYRVVKMTAVEDVIRKSDTPGHNNILSVVLAKR